MFRSRGGLQVVGHLAVGTLTAFNVIDHGHYVSEVLWGGFIGASRMYVLGRARRGLWE